MALTLQELFQDTKTKYKLTLHSGIHGLNSIVSWVHLMEDYQVADFFLGNEIVVTTGMAAKTSDGMIFLIEKLIQKQVAGLIINIGPYFKEIPEQVISYCEQHQFPLFSMPWEISMTRLIKDYCTRIFSSSQKEKLIADAFIHALLAPKNTSAYEDILRSYYNIEGNFQVVLLNVNTPESDHEWIRKKTDLIIRNQMSSHSYSYALFRYEHRFVLILNGTSESFTKCLCQEIINDFYQTSSSWKIRVGVGNLVCPISRLSDSYRRAKASVLMADYMEKPLVLFNDMGVYQIIFTVEDISILEEYYNNIMSPLENYDKYHNTNYVQTLLNYLKYEGSIQAVAEATFTHRNTVNYRMKKIREILGANLETMEERFPYQLAYYIQPLLHRR